MTTAHSDQSPSASFVSNILALRGCAVKLLGAHLLVFRGRVLPLTTFAPLPKDLLLDIALGAKLLYCSKF